MSRILQIDDGEDLGVPDPGGNDRGCMAVSTLRQTINGYNGFYTSGTGR